MARIVIVDDDELFCQIVARTLAPLGHMVVTVRDGDDALEALWANGPDLAILDCALPGKTGLTILREVRESAMFGKLPVIILTARRSEWHAKMAMTAGADAYVRKPFEPDDLIATIERLLAAAAPSHPHTTLLDQTRIADLRTAVGAEQADTLLAMMERDIADRTKTIVTALERGDGATALTQSHALRGAADGVGALELARLCRGIEREGQKDGGPIAACARATIEAIEHARAIALVQASTSSA